MIISSSTNINKTSNHLSPQIIEHKKITYDIMSLEILVKFKQLIVSSSTNINKTSNHLSPQIIEHKKIIGNPGQVQTIDCQQFHQYQQNQQSPLSSNH